VLPCFVVDVVVVIIGPHVQLHDGVGSSILYFQTLLAAAIAIWREISRVVLMRILFCVDRGDDATIGPS
jgi:hypothetical protein